MAAIAAGVVIYRRFPFRERIVLPVPAWSLWVAAMAPEARAGATREPVEALDAEMRAQMPASLRQKRARARYWSVECYRSLEKCDYRRASIAGRFSLEANPHCLEGALGRGIAAAYYGQAAVAQQMLGWALSTHGLGTSVSWGLGWAFSMLGNWAAAEAYLLDAAARCPDQATVWSLLGRCQWQLGKVREAAQSVRQAVGLEPGEPQHRILLARILLASGRAREALLELEAVESDALADFDALLAGVSANLLLGRLEEAVRRAALLEQAHPGSRTLLGLAQAYGGAGMHDQAYSLLEQVCVDGFCPEAQVGLARIEYERKEYEQARAHLLAALDMTRARDADVRGPLEFLEAVARGLTAMAEPVEGCQAWTATLELSAPPAKAQRLSLLVGAPRCTPPSSRCGSSTGRSTRTGSWPRDPSPGSQSSPNNSRKARSLRAFMGTGLSNGEPHDFSLRGRQLPDRVAQLDRLRPVRGAWCGQLGDLLQGNHGPRTAHRLEELPVGDAVQPVPQR